MKNNQSSTIKVIMLIICMVAAIAWIIYRDYNDQKNYEECKAVADYKYNEYVKLNGDDKGDGIYALYEYQWELASNRRNEYLKSCKK
jgi:hypothetical protein